MTNTLKNGSPAAKPPWLRRRLPTGATYEKVRAMIRSGNLHTVCQEARCPNQFECFSQQTATFLILGSRCTRNCRFCNIEPGPEGPPDPAEPQRVAQTAAEMGLRYVVVTSVTRDDLPDGGAGLFAATIRELRTHIPDVRIEVLIPDFQGDPAALETVLEAGPDVLNHNIETVPRLYPQVRPEAVYDRSLRLLQNAAAHRPAIPVKSGLMLGLGENPDEVRRTLLDLRSHGCTLLTIGQYLQPTEGHLRVTRFVPPEEFAQWRQEAIEMGFSGVAAGPFVRSSYHAKEMFQAANP
jgi:lipoic acid synthetase